MLVLTAVHAPPLHAAPPPQGSQIAESSGASPASDEAIQRAVGKELARDRLLNPTSVMINVDSGIVVLTGNWPVPSWRQRAQRIARAVRNVRAVVDRTVVVAVVRPDRTLAREVRRAVRATHALAGLPISISVTDGVVELTGGISSWEEQQLAELVATSVAGVRFCQNLLSARRDVVRTDAVLRGDIRSRIELDPLVAHDPVEVDVQREHVRLSGRVGSVAERRRLISLAWVKGVRSVDGAALAVDEADRPNPNARTRGLTDQEIRATIDSLRTRWPSVGSVEVELSVLQGVVTLRGSVPTQLESRAFEALAKSVVSVVAVQNQLRGPWWRPPTPPTRPAPRSRLRRNR